MGQTETQVGRLCEELGVTRQTLYRHVSPKGGIAARREKATVPKSRGMTDQFGQFGVFQTVSCKR
jgi:hypothetical protein